MKIYCAIKLSDQEKQYLIKNIGNQTLFFKQDISENQIDKFLQAEVCFGNIPREWVEQSVNLKWLQLESVGYDSYLSLNNKNVLISNLKGFFSIPVAESAVSGILTLLRGMNRLAILKENKMWEGASMRSGLRNLEGSDVLILGAGAIGQQLKKLLTAFNCQVSFFDKYSSQAQYVLINDLIKAIPVADIIIGCLPESPETIHLLNEERLNLMKPTAIVVNVGRGSLIDEDALVKKLTNKSIAGAVLDVTSKEPLPEDHALWSCPNTILSQHTAGGFGEEIMGKVNIFLNNLGRYTKKEQPKNLIV
jgi:phosphoglycerate dehydrogenase-like enzyme